MMGDTVINLDSPEDRSRVIFSREVIDKKLWTSTFNLGYEDRGNARRKKRPKKMSTLILSSQIARQTRLLFRTRVKQCDSCKGLGHFFALKKDGTVGKQRRVCKSCIGKGVVYIKTRNIYEWRENVRSSESGEGFKPQFFSEKGVCEH